MRIPVRVIKGDEEMSRRETEREELFAEPAGEELAEKRREDRGEDSPPSEEVLHRGLKAGRSETRKEPNAEGQTPVSRDDLASESSDQVDWRDQYVRLLAEFENYKRRAEAERERLAGVGKEAVLEDLYPLVEHMERALAAARQSPRDKGILEGLEMVYRELLSVLEKHGAERIPAVGHKFNPEVHDAVAVIPAPGVDPGTVVEELKPGFMRNGRLLRPASVVVAGEGER